MPEPIVFSQLGSVAGITRPITGTGEIPMASPNFDGYASDGVNKCLYLPKNWSGDTEFCSFTSNYGIKGTMIVRIKPDGWSFSGTSHSASRANTFLLFYKNGWSGGNAGLHSLYFVHGTGLLHEILTPTYFATTVTSASNAVSSGVWTEFEVVWERGANPSVEIYKDGNLIGSANHALQDFSPISRGRNVGSDNYPRTDYGLEGWCDRFQHYDVPIRDFTNRNNPRFGMNDQRMVV